MVSELRDSGISVVGDAPWGMHFCQFYETKQDLLDTLVPYFKAGLESKEFCVWVVSTPGLITVEQAKGALAQAVPDLDRHLSDENIEILNGPDWYLKDDVFNLERVTRAWDAKCKRALARGYDGMRVSGDTFWLAEKDWKDFFAYEKQLNESITDQPMTVLCTYPVAKSGAAEVLDVVHAHQVAIARRQGEWEVIETPKLIQKKAEIRRLTDELLRARERTPKAPLILRYGAAVLSVVAALIIARFLGNNLLPSPGMLFLCALMFSAWYCGFKPSLLALALSLLAFKYYFVTPLYSLTIEIKEIPRLLIFSVLGTYAVLLSAAQTRAAESLAHARNLLERTIQEVKRTNVALRAEIAERKQAEEALDERLRFETLVTELSAAFASLSPNEIDREIDKWLQTLVEFLGVDRASFFQFRDDFKTLYLGHSYTVPGIEPLSLPPTGVNEQFPWITDQLRRGNTIKWSRIPDDLPEQAAKCKEYAATTGAKSVLNIPVLVGGSVICTFSFTSIGIYCDWPDATVARLRLVGEIFAAAVERKRANAERKQTEEALRSGQERYRKLSENLPNGAVITYDTDLRVTFIAGRGLHEAGFSPDFFLGKLLGEIAPPEVVAIAEPHFRAAFGGQTETYEVPYPDGRVYFGAVAPLLNSDGLITEIQVISQDITKHKQAEEALRASEEQFRQLAENIREVFWLATADLSKMLYISPAYEVVWGQACESLYREPLSFFAAIHAEDRSRVVDIVGRNREQGCEVEYRVVRPDGSIRWIRDRRFPIRDDSGCFYRVAGIAEDITERKQAEEQLRQSERLLAEAQHLAHCGSWNWDLKNNLVTWSDELYRIFRVDPQTFIPAYEGFITALVHPEDRALIRDAIERSLKTQEPFSCYIRTLLPDGEERVIHTRGNIASDEQGNPIRIFGSAQDVTERKQAEEALRQAEQKYRDIFENAGEGIFQSTPGGRYIAANPALARMYGFASPEELTKSRQDISRQLYVDPKRREEFKLQIEEQDSVLGFEHQVFRKDGSKIWISANAHAVHDAQGGIQYYEGTVQDITDRKLAEELLRESEERYRDLVENSHDLICTHDLDGLILSANRAALEIMGYDSESEARATNLRDILPPEVRDQFDDYLKTICAESVASGIMWVQTRTGERRIWEYRNTLRTRGVSAPIVRGMARDITERKRHEEALRESEQELRLFNLATNDMFWNWNFTTDKVVRSMGFERVFGYAEVEVNPSISWWEERLHPDDSERVLTDFRTALQRGDKTCSYEYRFRRHNGSYARISDRAYFVRDESGTAVRALGAMSDITERKQAEDALREAEQKYRDIFENAGEGIFQSTPAGRYIAANPALARMYGFASPEELIQSRRDISQQVYVDPARREEFERLIKAEETIRGFEVQAFRKDGSKIWVSVNARAVLDAKGIINYYEGTIQEITDRKRAEEALRESEERYRELFENAKDALYVHDLKGRYISANRAAEKLSGRSREDIIGRTFVEFLAPDQVEEVREHLCKKLVQQGETTYETAVITSDGRRIAVEVSSHMIYQNNIRVAVQGTARDITERKLAEDQLREAKDFSDNLIQTANVIILGLDTRGNINIFNQTAEEITGYTAAEVKGRSWFEKLVPRDRYLYVWDEFLKVVGNGMSKPFENPILTKSGEERIIRWQNNQVKVNDKIVGTISFGNDITERRRTQEALRQSEERFSKAFQSSPVALSIALLDDGRLLEVNESFLRVTGYSREDVIGRKTVDLGLWETQAMANALSERGPVENLEIKFQQKSGETREGLLSAELINLGAGPSVLGIVQDVTERNRFEKALQSYPRQLIEAQELEREHIARELHDQIGQQLTAVRINLQAIWKTCDTEDSRALIDQGMAIVDEALEQVRSLSFELRPTLLDDLGLVAALRWYADQFTQRTGIQVRCAINPPKHQARCRQELEIACFRIVQEALTNVVRHAKAKNVFIELGVLDQEIVLNIKDDGIGFSEQAATGGPSAIHLGLRGMKERALALNGTLEIKSTQERGTEIRASFPTDCKED